jgi:hypothetical protein
MMKDVLRSLWPARWRSGGYMHGLVRRRTRSVVWSGPFRGMRYIDYSFCSALMPKLIGIYEKELHAAVEDLIAWRPEVVVDIGAAEGYYAVGLASRLPTSTIVAFEADEGARQQLSQLADLNNCTNIRVEGLATPAALSAAVTDNGAKVAVVCDCEGAELDLLSPDDLPWQRSTFIICELHDFLRPGIEQALVARFRPTHRVSLLPAVPRMSSEFPFHTLISRLFPNRWVQMALGENRPAPMKWLVASPSLA